MEKKKNLAVPIGVAFVALLVGMVMFNPGTSKVEVSKNPDAISQPSGAGLSQVVLSIPGMT